jgi:hypothetical protein
LIVRHLKARDDLSVFPPHHDLSGRVQCGRLLEELEGLGAVLPLLEFNPQLDERFGQARLLLVEPQIGRGRIFVGGDIEDLPVEFLGRAGIARDPVELGAVGAEEEQERRARDGIPLIEFLTADVAAERAEEDEMIVEEFDVFRIVVVLLTQQYAVSSAGLGEKVDEQRLPRRFRRGQGVFERALAPGLSGEGDREKHNGGKGEPFFHVATPKAKFPISDLGSAYRTDHAKSRDSNRAIDNLIKRFLLFDLATDGGEEIGDDRRGRIEEIADSLPPEVEILMGEDIS